MTTPNTELMELPPPTEDVVVLARNPAEVLEAQGQLLSWAESKVESVKAELREAEQSLEQSKRLKIRTSAWVSQVAAGKRRIAYYEKICEAIRAGYYIVPNFPVQIIAVKTERLRIDRHTTAIRTDSSPIGEGRYVSPDPEVKRKWDEETQQATPDSARLNEEIDFPFKLVKPKILSDLADAMKLGIFDEIGVFPVTTASPYTPVPKNTLPVASALVPGDPMVVGIVNMPRHGQGPRRTTFLISWWIDTRDL